MTEIKFQIEPTPEDPSAVAMELAEAMQSELLHKAEIDKYTNLIEQERMKLRELTNLSFEVRKRRREGYKPKSRMDPWAEYDLKSIEQDLAACKSRARKYREIIEDQQKRLQWHKNRIPRIKKRLAKAKEAAKTK